MSETLCVDRNIINGSLAEVIRRNRKRKRPVLIYGPPGVGKSEQINQAQEDGDLIIDCRLNILEAIDLRGMPYINSEKSIVEWAKPDFIPTEEGILHKGKVYTKGILFLDEINTAHPSVQNAALQLVLDGRIGPHQLGKDWYICGAGNRSEDRAHVSPLSGPLIDRFAVYDYLPDYITWSNWAIKSGIHDSVVGFIGFRRELLLQPRVDEYTPSTNPRSWSYVSDCMKHGHTTLADIRACIGSPASEFMSYLEVYKNIPDIEKLVSGKAKWKEDKSKISVSYAISTSLASYIIGSKTPEKIIENCMNIITNMSPEPAALFIRRIMNSGEKIQDLCYESKGVDNWLENNRELITSSMALKN
jgi:hypothetical protein